MINLMHHKKSPNIFIKPFSEALTYFPELNNIYILIQETSFHGVQHTLRAYPPLVTLHWKISNWVYAITINKNKNINLSFYDVPFEEQVGFFLHELSHIAYYINFKKRDVFLFSIKYLFNKEFVRKLEKETDLRVIEKGGGVYLVLQRILLLNFRQNKPYKEVADTYITINELIENLKKYPNLYKKEEIEMCIDKYNEIKNTNTIHHPQSYISITRKIKHTLKTVLAFIYAYPEMFYLITIKKTHLK